MSVSIARSPRWLVAGIGASHEQALRSNQTPSGLCARERSCALPAHAQRDVPSLLHLALARMPSSGPTDTPKRACSGACPTAQPWQCVLCNTSKTPMRRNHPVHGPKTLCNACGVRLSRRVKADRNKASERGTSAGGIKPVRTALRQVKPSAPLDEVPRTRTERKRSARALDALGLSPDDPEATAHKVSVPSPARAKTARLGCGSHSWRARARLRGGRRPIGNDRRPQRAGLSS